MMRTLKKCEWKEIEAGEVFASKTCWTIGLKINSVQWRLIDCNWNSSGCDFYGNIWDIFHIASGILWTKHDLYKLPLEVQQLWRCD